MTAPVELALVGKISFREVRKEELLECWTDIVQKTDLQIAFNECMQGIERLDDGFIVHTSQGDYNTRSVLLAIGRRGTPRKLGVEGEETTKVVYRLVDAEQYKGKKVLVVGGGDSALEAALALSEQPGTEVWLSYRGDGFSRAKQKNRQLILEQQAKGGLTVMLGSNVTSIEIKTVHIEHEGRVASYQNDAVIVCAGGQLPTPLLKKIGIEFDTKYGSR